MLPAWTVFVRLVNNCRNFVCFYLWNWKGLKTVWVVTMRFSITLYFPASWRILNIKPQGRQARWVAFAAFVIKASSTSKTLTIQTMILKVFVQLFLIHQPNYQIYTSIGQAEITMSVRQYIIISCCYTNTALADHCYI